MKNIYWRYRQEILLFVILASIAVSKWVLQSQSITITAVSDRRDRFLLSQSFQRPNKLRANWVCHKNLKRKQELRHACMHNYITGQQFNCTTNQSSSRICIIKLGKTTVLYPASLLALKTCNWSQRSSVAAGSCWIECQICWEACTPPQNTCSQPLERDGVGPPQYLWTEEPVRSPMKHTLLWVSHNPILLHYHRQQTHLLSPSQWLWGPPQYHTCWP